MRPLPAVPTAPRRSELPTVCFLASGNGLPLAMTWIELSDRPAAEPAKRRDALNGYLRATAGSGWRRQPNFPKISATTMGISAREAG